MNTPDKELSLERLITEFPRRRNVSRALNVSIPLTHAFASLPKVAIKNYVS